MATVGTYQFSSEGGEGEPARRAEFGSQAWSSRDPRRSGAKRAHGPGQKDRSKQRQCHQHHCDDCRAVPVSGIGLHRGHSVAKEASEGRPATA